MRSASATVVDLPSRELLAGDHRDARRGLRQRNLDLRGRDDQRFRHGADRERRPRRRRCGSRRRLDRHRLGAEAVGCDAQLEASCVGRRRRELAARVRWRRCVGHAGADDEHARDGDGASVGIDDAAGDRAGVRGDRAAMSERQGKERENGIGIARGLLLGVHARRWTKGRPGVRYPDLRIVAASPAFPREQLLAVAAGRAGTGDAAPRLQWRHRVGLSPTSRGRRAELSRFTG